MSLSTTQSPTSFADLKLSGELLTAIEKLGFTKPTRVQQQAIPAAMQYRDLLISAETGSGKTAAFLLPILQRLMSERVAGSAIGALILSPTRELARQTFLQCQQLAELTDIKITLITGGEDFKRQQGALRHSADIVIATPGRILELLEQEDADVSQLAVLVLDEADRMLDMGFRDTVLNIVGHCNTERQTILCSATLLNGGVIRLADKVLNDYQIIALNALTDEHGHITQQIVLADDHTHKQQLLAWLLLNDTYDKALVFTNTRVRAHELQGPLRGQKLTVGVLHGEMEANERKRVITLFREGTIKILVATDLAARGLDIKGVDLVINFDPPKNAVSYLHRVGRTGRAEQNGIGITLVSSVEWNLMAGIQRLLQQRFIQRSIKELAGHYQGPKKLKGSGKAASGKKKPSAGKKVATEKKIKIRDRDRKNIGKRRTPSNKDTPQNNA